MLFRSELMAHFDLNCDGLIDYTELAHEESCDDDDGVMMVC